MLLFFIAHLSAFAGECTSQNINQKKLSYTIHVCENDNFLFKNVEESISWWQSQGESVYLNQNIKDCSQKKKRGDIYISYNNYEVSLENRENFTADAVTDWEFGLETKAILKADIFLSTRIEDHEMLNIVRHEIGHAIGYDHVSKECYGYALNPFTSRMGSKL